MFGFKRRAISCSPQFRTGFHLNYHNFFFYENHKILNSFKTMIILHIKKEILSLDHSFSFILFVFNYVEFRTKFYMNLSYWLVCINLYISLFFGIKFLGFISIDCGSTYDYLDEDTGIFYKSDTGFVDTMTNNVISPEYYSSNTVFGRQLISVRSFPQGTKNCYTLKPEQGKSSNYLIRALFQYGNYDNKNEFPKFDLYDGVNYWSTVEISSVSYTIYPDIIYVPSSDTIFVCLINTGSGIPFISGLELRPLDKSLYPFDFGTLQNGWRYDMGSTTDKVFVRWISYNFFFSFISFIFYFLFIVDRVPRNLKKKKINPILIFVSFIPNLNKKKSIFILIKQ